MSVDIHLGDEVKDVITGFQGIATARARFLTSCDRVEVQPRVKEYEGGQKLEAAEWFDVTRLVVVEAGVVSPPPLQQPTNPAAVIPVGG